MATNDGTIDPDLCRLAFLRRAREAVHQVLFYLELGHQPVTDPLIGRIPYFVRWNNSVDTSLREASADIFRRVSASLDSVGWDSRIGADPAVVAWQRLVASLKGEFEFPSASAKLRRDCTAFLDATRPKGRFAQHAVSLLLNWVDKTLFSLIASAIAVVVLWKVEQIRGLFQNAGRWGTIPPVLVLLLPLLFLWIAARQKNSAGSTYFWDVGGAPFRSLFYPSTPSWDAFPNFAAASPLPGLLFWRIALNVCFYLSVLALVLLATVGLSNSLADPAAITSTLALTMLFLFIAVAQIIDFWDYYSPSPIRLYFIGITAVSLMVLNLKHGYWVALVLFGIPLIVHLLYLFFATLTTQSRVYHIAFTVIFSVLVGMTLNGGRAQTSREWKDEPTAPALARLSADKWPWQSGGSRDPVVVMAASGGGSRAAVTTALTLSALHTLDPDIACNLQAISSVSGGSLANAAYVSRRFDAPNCARVPGLDHLPQDVAGDYMLATAIGLLTGRGRGHVLEETWRKPTAEGGTGLGDRSLGDLVDRWQSVKGERPPFPLPLFNSTTLDNFDVVISPLEGAAYSPVLTTASAKANNLYDSIPLRFGPLATETDEPTSVFYRDGLYSLEDLLPKFNPRLDQCVRASANFPFGFPLVRVRTKQPQYLSPDRKMRKPHDGLVFLTDGGVLSNSGMWSLYRLLMNRSAALRERGVLLIIVDASSMPEPEPFGRISNLINAIGSKEPKGVALHRRMLEALNAVYGGNLEVVQLDLVPTQRLNVPTTWTLSRTGLSDVRESFDLRWSCKAPQGAPAAGVACQPVQAQVTAAWRRLTQGPRQQYPLENAFDRVPLD